MFETIGPVWDGNEVWLVVAAGATFAAFPAWYATMFSGFYIALLLVLVPADRPRRSRSSGARRARARAGRPRGCGRTSIGSVGVPFVWGVALPTLLYGVPLDSDGDFAGNFFDLFSLYSVFAGLALVLLFALHGATFLSLRTTGELAASGRPRTARRLALPAAARRPPRFLVWTVAVAVDRNDKDVFPPVLPAVLGIAAFVLAVVFVFARAKGVAFAMTAVGIVLARRDPLHEPLPARDGVCARLRKQPDRLERVLFPLRAGRDDRCGADPDPARPALSGLDVLRFPRPPEG